jgi:hypothetical protein
MSVTGVNLLFRRGEEGEWDRDRGRMIERKQGEKTRRESYNRRLEKRQIYRREPESKRPIEKNSGKDTRGTEHLFQGSLVGSFSNFQYW